MPPALRRSLMAELIGTFALVSPAHALWLYLVAPPLGAALGAVAYQYVRAETAVDVRSTRVEKKAA